MITRFPAVPLTRTDWAIYVWMSARMGMSIERYMLHCLGGDNVDAELMLILMEWRNLRSRPDAWRRALSHALGAARTP